MGAAVRFSWGGSGSRRRQAREQEPAVCKVVRLATLPCPRRGKGRCQCAGLTLFAPLGQKRFRVARLILEASRERAGSWGALPIRNGWQARRGTGKGARRFTIFRTRKSQRSAPSARPVLPAIPQGERRALPAPAQGIHPLRIPFWGTGLRFPAAPSPKTPQAAGPCSWACRRLFPLPPPPERNAASPPHS